MRMVPKLNTMQFDKDIPFKVVAPFEPMGDQPKAVEDLAAGVANGQMAQVLLGATGTGKTFTIAKVIEKVQKPTLVIAHENDGLHPIRAARLLKERIPNCRLVSAPSREYWREHPDEFFGAIQAFHDEVLA